MSKQNDYKLPLSVLGIYEVCMILILSFKDLCDSILCVFYDGYSTCPFCKYKGLQYVIVCLLIPVVCGIIWWWHSEIKNVIDAIKKDIKKRCDTLEKAKKLKDNGKKQPQKNTSVSRNSNIIATNSMMLTAEKVTVSTKENNVSLDNYYDDDD